MKIEEQSNATILLWIGALVFICGGLMRWLSLFPGYEGVGAWGLSSMMVGSVMAILATAYRKLWP